MREGRRPPMLVVELFLAVAFTISPGSTGGGSGRVADPRIHHAAWEALSPQPLDENDLADLEEGCAMATGEVRAGIDDPEAVKVEWLDRLNALVGEVEGWARAAGWRTRRIDKTVNERRLGTYKVPVLLMEKDTVEVVLNPVARSVPGADGAVDLYLAPAYDDIASLYLEGGHWVVHYGERPDPMASESALEITPRPYAEQTIRTILDGMAAHG
jgi:hypothetical protein